MANGRGIPSAKQSFFRSLIETRVAQDEQHRTDIAFSLAEVRLAVINQTIYLLVPIRKKKKSWLVNEPANNLIFSLFLFLYSNIFK